jgi:DNA-binding sugar fermentation-stimulating protein
MSKPLPPPPIALYSFQAPLREAVVVARPSKVVKTPYVADIQFPGEEKVYQAHAPSLGCSGLVDVGSHVYVHGKEPKEGGAKTSHTIYGTTVHGDSSSKGRALRTNRQSGGDFHVGVNPMVANRMVRAIIELGLAAEWRTLGDGVASIQAEVTAGDSRVDLRVSHKDGSTTWVEVKNVPLSHYRNGVKGCPNYRAAAAEAVPTGLTPHDKIALFPDGYRKKKEDAISPRATKHLDNLADLVRGGDRAYCIFLCQRTDARRFEPAALDAVYTAAFKAALAAGVEARCYVAGWTDDFMRAHYRGELPVVVPS